MRFTTKQIEQDALDRCWKLIKRSSYSKLSEKKQQRLYRRYRQAEINKRLARY